MKNPGNHSIILSLALSQALNSACVPISFIVASLAIVDLAGGDGRWAGVPSALGMTAGALASFSAGRVLPSLGYRGVLGLAGLAGMTGSLVAGIAASSGRLLPFLGAFFLLGAAIGLIGLSRYAAAEASEPSARARSIGRVVLGSTAGAVLGPLLVDPARSLAILLGLPEAAGPWLATGALYGTVILNTAFLLRPEPKALARLLAAGTGALPGKSPGAAPTPLPARPFGALLRDRRVLLPMGALVSAQVAMVLVMAITPLHMHTHHHAMGAISHVLTAHFLGMYGLSILSGWLADRLGRMRAVGLGGAILVLSCLLAPLSHGTGLLMASLFLLGLGWSFCFIGGSSALSALAEGERGRVQGLTEALVSLSSGVASLSSGILFAGFGFSTMAKVGLVASLLPLVCFLASRAAPAAEKAMVPGA